MLTSWSPIQCIDQRNHGWEHLDAVRLVRKK